MHRRRRRREYRRRGFISTSTLMALLIILSLLPIMIGSFSVIASSSLFDQNVQDLVALFQIRRILNVSYNIQTDSENVFFEYKDDNWKLSEVNNHILLSPGTQFIFDKIDSHSFYIENGMLYINYYRNDKEYNYVLSKV